MKKVLAVFLITIMLMYSGCSNSEHWEFQKPADQVVGLYIVNIEHFAKYEIIKELDLSLVDKFYKDVGKLQLWSDGIGFGPSGLGFVIKYSDTCFTILSCELPTEWYDLEKLDGMIFDKEFITEEFYELVNKYLKI